MPIECNSCLLLPPYYYYYYYYYCLLLTLLPPPPPYLNLSNDCNDNSMISWINSWEG